MEFLRGWARKWRNEETVTGISSTVIQVVSRIYNGNQEWVDYEMAEIKFACEEERAAKAKHAGTQ